MRTGTATPKTANTPRFRGENRKPRSTTSRANPFASTNLFGITSVGVRGPATATRAGGDGGGGGGGGWGRWMVGSVAGGVEPFDRARGREAGASAGGEEDARERGGSSRARGEARDALSLARGRGARTRGGVTRRARGPRGTATRYRARARAVLQVETQSREKMEHLPICVSSVRTLSRASSGRGRHFGYCPSLFAFSASCDLLPRREQRPSPSPRVTPPRGGTRDPGPRPRASPRHGGEAPRPRRRRLPQDRGPRGVHARAAPRGGGVEGARGRVARLRRRPLPERRRVGGPRRRDRRERVRDAARVRRRARGPRPRAPPRRPRAPRRDRAPRRRRVRRSLPPDDDDAYPRSREGPRPRRRGAPRRARDRRRGTPRSVRVRAWTSRTRPRATPTPPTPPTPPIPPPPPRTLSFPAHPPPSGARPRRRVRARPRALSPTELAVALAHAAMREAGFVLRGAALGDRSADPSLDAFDGLRRRIRGGGATTRRPAEGSAARAPRRAPRRDGRGEGAGRRPHRVVLAGALSNDGEKEEPDGIRTRRRPTRRADVDASALAALAEYFPSRIGGEEAKAAGGGASREALPARFSPELFRSAWHAAKDRLATPLRRDACEFAGLPPPPALLSLPEELKALAFAVRLDARDLCAVASTCRELRSAADSNDAWRPAFERAFGRMRRRRRRRRRPPRRRRSIPPAVHLLRRSLLRRRRRLVQAALPRARRGGAASRRGARTGGAALAATAPGIVPGSPRSGPPRGDVPGDPGIRPRDHGRGLRPVPRGVRGGLGGFRGFRGFGGASDHAGVSGRGKSPEDARRRLRRRLRRRVALPSSRGDARGPADARGRRSDPGAAEARRSGSGGSAEARVGRPATEPLRRRRRRRTFVNATRRF